MTTLSQLARGCAERLRWPPGKQAATRECAADRAGAQLSASALGARVRQWATRVGNRWQLVGACEARAPRWVVNT